MLLGIDLLQKNIIAAGLKLDIEALHNRPAPRPKP